MKKFFISVLVVLIIGTGVLAALTRGFRDWDFEHNTAVAGPAGEQGPQGEPGAVGPAGPQGEPGSNGGVVQRSKYLIPGQNDNAMMLSDLFDIAENFTGTVTIFSGLTPQEISIVMGSGMPLSGVVRRITFYVVEDSVIWYEAVYGTTLMTGYSALGNIGGVKIKTISGTVGYIYAQIQY